jgi:hypothetical protein
MAETVVPGATTVVNQNATQNINPRLTAMFTKPITEVGIVSVNVLDLEPIRAPAENDEDFVFQLPETGGSFIDLRNTLLKVTGCLKLNNGQALPENPKVILSNNCLYSLFESVIVHVGHNQAEIYTSNYHYKSYLKQLKDNKFKAAPDRRLQGVHFDLKRDRKSDYDIGGNRAYYTNDGASVSFSGPTLIDFFQTDGLLIPGTPLSVRFRKSRPSFYLTASPELANAHDYKFVIEKIILKIPCIIVEPALAPLLEMQTDEKPGSYTFNSIDLKQFSVPAGTIVQKYTKVYEGKIPKKIAICFFSQGSFSGDITKSPYLTQPLDVRIITIYLNGIAVRQIDANFNSGMFVDCYSDFISWMSPESRDYFIEYEFFKDGYTFFCVDLFQHCSVSNPCSEEMFRQGYVDISIQLGAASREHNVMCVFGEGVDFVEVNKGRSSRHVKIIQ